MTVIVYSTTTCPYCKMLKEWLTEKSITYTEKVVDQDKDGLNEMMAISDGHMGVPFSVITKDDGAQVKIIGFDKQKFQQTLGIS